MGIEYNKLKKKPGSVLKGNIEARSPNHVCLAKAINITHSECLYSYFIYPASKNASALLYCHLWPVWLSHIFLRYVIKGMIFFKHCMSRLCLQVL